MTSMLSQFKSARRVGTPLISIKTFDAESLMQSLQKQCNSNTPICQWDCIGGLRHRNELGEDATAIALGDEPIESTQNATAMAEIAMKFPEGTILFMLNAHRFLDKHDFTQALWNLRDPFKSSQRTIVLLGPDFRFPVELQQDILVLDEPLPNETELKTIVAGTVKAAKVSVPDAVIEKAVDALRGLAAFPAEQATAMSISKAGLDIDGLWERKRQLIQQTDGISVWNEGIKFADLGGIEAAKKRGLRIIKGRNPFRVVVWLDEGEKAMAGSASIGDTSGTSQDQLSVLLSEMQDKNYNGMLLVGVPGGAKSAFAKALAHEAGVLLIRLDLGALKGSLVGESEHKIRQAMKIIEAVGGPGGAFFVMTSNDIRIVKPELKRRFRKGIWFFDIPTKTERDAIWPKYLNKYDVNPYRLDVDDSNWTGAEIETCVTTAWEENITLAEAAKGIIPVAVSGKEDIERLRREANGRYNSASSEGVYRYSSKQLSEEPQGRRFAKENN